jgi:hypothetical protein
VADVDFFIPQKSRPHAVVSGNNGMQLQILWGLRCCMDLAKGYR